MTNQDDLIEQMARALFEEAWDAGIPHPNRFLASQYTTAARTILPFIEAARIEGAELMREAAAKEAEGYLESDDYDSRDCDVVCPDRIRALDAKEICNAKD